MKLQAGALFASIALLGSAQLNGCHEKSQPASSGPAGDAGAAAAVLQLIVKANPNSVLSAVATVSWSVPLMSVTVSVRTEGAAAGQLTPAVDLSNKSSPVVIPVVPLEAGTTYVLQATATDPAGKQWDSNSVSFATGALPSGVPFFTVADGGTPSPGYTLVARLAAGTGPDYVTIVDANGAPVWYYVPPSGLTGDFQQQPDGTFTLAITAPRGSSNVVPTPFEYQQIDVLGNQVMVWRAIDVPNTGAAWVPLTGTNNHEIRLQPNGDALLYGFAEETLDLSGYGGKTNAVVLGDVLERITINGDVTFFWNSFEYLSPGDVDPVATNLTADDIDLTHTNAIDVMDDGSYLLSLRNYSQLLKIDSTTGAVSWRLGGTHGDFTFLNDPLGGFSCQHGARELSNGDIIVFDDGNGHTPQQSRAAEYQLDTTASPMTATLVWSAEDSPALYTQIMGYAQRLRNGNTLIAYGTTMVAQEVNDAGTVLWQLSDIDGGDAFYRAYRLDSLSPQALLPPD